MDKHNVIVVICHDLGKHLGCYGVPHVRSNNIDGFAESAIRFDHAFCTAPQCSPSRASLWTGRFPHNNGVVGLTQGDFQNDLNPDEVHLAQILRDADYETHVFGDPHEVRNATRSGHEHIHDPSGWFCEVIATDFSNFLAKRPASHQPLFAEVCLFEPHRPFPHDGVNALDHSDVMVPAYLPDIPEVREDLAEMEASIVSADQAFGRILESVEAAGIMDNTIVIFTSDHGIPFSRAKMTLYDPGIEISLMMRVPGQSGGRVHKEMISNIDVLPTILDLLELQTPSNIQGRSFCSLIKDAKYTPRDAIFTEKTYHSYYDPRDITESCG